MRVKARRGSRWRQLDLSWRHVWWVLSRGWFRPVWVAAGVGAAGSALRAAPSWWWVPVVVVMLVAVPLYVWGQRLSSPVQRVVLALVPSAVDDGRRGVLDRPTERGYLAVLLLAIGGWVSWIAHAGWSPTTWWAFVASLAVVGAPWWWHRRIRRSVNRYVRVHPVLANEIKGYAGSRAMLVSASRAVTVIRVRLKPSLNIEHVGAEGLRVASAYGLRPGAVTISGDPQSARTVYHRVVPRDPWKDRIPHPMPEVGSLTFDEAPRVTVALLDDATEQQVRILQMVGAVGRRGSGKSTLVESLLIWLTAYQHVAVVGADLAGGATLGVFEPMMAAPIATTADDALAQMRGLFAVGEHRERKLAAAKRKDASYGNLLHITDEDPALFWVCDEFPELVKAGGKVVVDVATRIAAKFRKVNIIPVVAGQNPTETDFGSTEFRAQIENLFGLLLDRRQSTTLWGSDQKLGWDSTILGRGQHLLRSDDVQTPRIAKGFYVSDAQKATRMREITQAAQATGWGRLTSESLSLLTGTETAPPLGGDAVGQRPILTVVKSEPVEEWKSAADDLAERVWQMLPEKGGDGRKPAWLLSELGRGVSRAQLNRALAKLRKEGRAWTPKHGEWART